MKSKLTQAELKRQLHYDPETGIFTWLVNKRGCAKIGGVAGTLAREGYIRITIKGKGYKAHRLACLYMEGYWPEHQMDHKFGVRYDNRWSELQHVTQSCNMQNQKTRNDNKSGFPGVSWDKQRRKWVSQICVMGKHIFIGRYNDQLEAALARYTVEDQCSKWVCNYRSELVKSIKGVWPEFKTNEG